MEKIIITLVVAFLLLNAYPKLQAQTLNKEPNKTPTAIIASVVAQGQYFGLRVGIEKTLKSVEKKNGYGEIYKTKERAVQYSLGFYHHGGFHTNLFLGSEYVFRRINKRGFIREFKSGIALSRTFLPTTYTVDDVTGAVSTKSLAGKFYFMPSLSFGIGKDFSKTKSKRNLAIHANLNLGGLLPYNGLVLPTPMLEIGIRKPLY